MRIKKILIIFVLALCAVPVLFADDAPDIGEIVRKIDELYRSGTSYSEIEMQIVTPHWERTLVLKAWTEGMKKTFIRILAPAKDKGVSTLRIGNEMWNYLPNVNKAIKIPPSMMMSSWMGSDFTNDDLVKESTMSDDYTYKLLDLPAGGPGLLYVEFIPKENKPIVWDKVVVAVRKNDYLPVEEKYYDEKGNLMRVLTFSEIRQFGDRIIPSLMEMVPQNKPGQKTVIRYKDIKFGVVLDKETFTLRNLRAEK